ncbi:WD40/YVTN/BNR-like repeat-containing protein [Pseudobowmanella zhangzhouensis]|uniref:WD40/YVTN/BNR-like repeat-containing protein n=1 Tax=Pseudobowmanella zhangzhouensis TaxID=1537679 RepID=UPI003616CECB
MRKKLALSMTVASLNVLAQSLPAEVNFQSVTRQGATIYASGTQGSVYRSDDNGANWQQIALPSDAASLQIRDIAITGEQKLLAMSAGEGNQSRLYYSADAALIGKRYYPEANTAFSIALIFTVRKVGYMATATSRGWLCITAAMRD